MLEKNLEKAQQNGESIISFRLLGIMHKLQALTEAVKDQTEVQRELLEFLKTKP
jgi:hypothetical protein